MAHDHSEHRTLAMSSDWIQTLVFRHEIIQQYVVPSPTWEMSLNDCLIASALLDKITENIPVKDHPELRHAKMLVELRILTLYGPVIGPKEVPIIGWWDQAKGDANQLWLEKETWIDAYESLVAGLGFIGTLSFEGEPIGRGILIETHHGLKLERGKRLVTWKGSRTGTLRWAPDEGYQRDLPRGMHEMERIIDEIVETDPMGKVASSAIRPPDPSLN